MNDNRPNPTRIVPIIMLTVFALFESIINLSIYLKFTYAYDEMKAYTDQNGLVIGDIHYFWDKEIDYNSLSYIYFDYEDHQEKVVRVYWYEGDQPSVEVQEVIMVFDETPPSGPGKQVEVPDIFYRSFKLVRLLDFKYLGIAIIFYFVLFIKAVLFTKRKKTKHASLENATGSPADLI